MPQSIYDNGGFIGKTLDFGDTDRYVITPEVPANLTYVGGLTNAGLGTTSTIDAFDFASLSPAIGDIIIASFATSAAATGALTFRIQDDNTLFTQVANLFSNDSEDTVLQVGYKVLSSLADTEVTIQGGSGSTAAAWAATLHIWRGVDTSNPIDVTTQTVTLTNTGIPNPPAITPVTNGAVVIAVGASGHNGGRDTFTSSDLSNFLTQGGDDTDDVSIGMGSIAWTGGAVDPAAFGWTQSDSTAFSAAAVTLALRPVFTPAVLGNQKNSGIWSLSAVLESIEPVTTGVAFTHIATVETTSSSGGTIPLSSYQVGDVAVVLRYSLDTSPYTVVEPGTGWTSGLSQYVPASENAAYTYDFSWDVWYKVLTGGDLSSGATFQTLFRNYATVLIFRPATALSSVSLVRAGSSYSPPGTVPTSVSLLSTSDPSNAISIAQTSYGTGTNSYAFTAPGFISDVHALQSQLYSHYRIATSPEDNTLTSGDTASSINVLFGVTLQGVA